jgi:hypothetical protein
MPDPEPGVLVFKETSYRDIEHRADFDQHLEAWICNLALNLADQGSVNPRFERKTLLGELMLSPKRSDITRKRASQLAEGRFPEVRFDFGPHTAK